MGTLLIVLRLLCQGNEEDLPAPPLRLLYLTAEWATIAFFFRLTYFIKMFTNKKSSESRVRKGTPAALLN